MNLLLNHLRLALLFKSKKEDPTPPDVTNIPVKEPGKKVKQKMPSRGKKIPKKV